MIEHWIAAGERLNDFYVIYIVSYGFGYIHVKFVSIFQFNRHYFAISFITAFEPVLD